MARKSWDSRSIFLGTMARGSWLHGDWSANIRVFTRRIFLCMSIVWLLGWMLVFISWKWSSLLVVYWRFDILYCRQRIVMILRIFARGNLFEIRLSIVFVNIDQLLTRLRISLRGIVLRRCLGNRLLSNDWSLLHIWILLKRRNCFLVVIVIDFLLHLIFQVKILC